MIQFVKENNAMNKKEYQELSKKTAKKSPILKNCTFAFLCGGGICTIAQAVLKLFTYCGQNENDAKKWIPIILIFFACLFTGIGWFDKFAKKVGAGTLVPITGFANAMCSPAIDNKAEGFILGVGAKMFTIAGPVIVYGTVASVVYGVVYWVTTLF